MDNENRSWFVWVIVAFVAGGILGYVTTKLVKLVVMGAQWEFLINMITPLFIVLSLLFVLLLYQKDKEDTME